jgi:ribonuclease Z
MEKIEVTFLGTGNAVPTEKRNHTGILVSFKDENILVDCGEGIQRQFKIAKISPAKLTRILITHWHGDHILGLPGLLQTLAMSGYQRALKIYGPKGTNYFMHIIKSLVGNFHINIEVHEVSGLFVNDKDFSINAEEMTHDTPCNAYSIILKDKFRLDKKKVEKLKLPNSPLLGELQNGRDIVFNGKKIKAKSITFLDEGKKISFVLDTLLSSKVIEFAKDSDLIVSEATFSKEEEEKAKEYRHLTSEDAATIAKKSKSKKLILTHISQRYEHIPEVIEKEAKKIFKNTSLVKDFDVIEV